MKGDDAPSKTATGGGLRREVGLAGAILLGLGSMVGTGVFVSTGLAAGIAGPALLAATFLAALVATANGLSSAQLAAARPVSGGTYEYGYLWLSPAFGFTAGWMFLLAKSASAATAALGLSGYLLGLARDAGGATAGAELPAGAAQAALAQAALEGQALVERLSWGVVPSLRVAVAVAAVVAITAFVAGGIRRSNRGNAIIVAITLAGLAFLIAAALPAVIPERLGNFTPFLPGGEEGGVAALLHGAALMFVAFTGYGRIATLGEEVREPRRVIPRAVVLTMIVVSVLYLGVAFAGVGVLGAEAFGQAAERTVAPLETVAEALDRPVLSRIVAVAAVTAMAGVLLNLVLGLSRVLLAMSRRGDAPAFLGRIDAKLGSPVASVWSCGILVAAIALIGNVRIAWSFSAFTVLVYYAITNLAALRLPAEQRMFPRWVAAAGLVGCLSLAFWVEARVWLVGLGLLALGLAAHLARRRWRRSA